MFRSVTPPLPSKDHIDQCERLIKKHNDTLLTMSSDIQEYFSKALLQFAKSSPKELHPIYNGFIKSGVKFASSFVGFLKKLSPQLATISDLENKYAVLSDRFSEYQNDIKSVRDEETPENIEKEKKDLLAFVEQFQKFNTDSNVFLPCFLMLYISCCTQLSQDTTAFLNEINSLIKSYKPIEKSKEEKEVEDLIAKLETELQQYNEKQAQLQQQAITANQTQKVQENPEK
ncbi:hypothetical protein TVAG_399610 [Trichomonas vaginalis G3]|uniref:Uncharacterized protein n=1 Tax=Trichomonas vaginalis (strain ATCC PRA-98 / G3) TaxID=412133 RepID=A2E5Z8_TRIV3|nr:hypothetical protein TVAGG3_0337450 [Trichomonas vaginalis G3]EAY11955.1 hypothetical protein TVAG_399610 [Trichomonas vaginalis G3]KAI5530380.1 hypothetical protein TVAGG3_0337450 [Trichomonas vaginalis G3]|eukprot:XP_001324178.1 hypothetical protein [Trichomonas vaginalis G3]